MLAAISEVQVELHRTDKRRWPATGVQMSVSGKDRSRQSEEKTCLLSAAALFSDQLGRVLINPARWELFRRMTLRSESE
ncbi:MAG: hypothetical protein QOE73_1651 [Verrucomicrobiota bacterium]